VGIIVTKRIVLLVTEMDTVDIHTLDHLIIHIEQNKSMLVMLILMLMLYRLRDPVPGPSVLNQMVMELPLHKYMETKGSTEADRWK